MRTTHRTRLYAVRLLIPSIYVHLFPYATPMPSLHAFVMGMFPTAQRFVPPLSVPDLPTLLQSFKLQAQVPPLPFLSLVRGGFRCSVAQDSGERVVLMDTTWQEPCIGGCINYGNKHSHILPMTGRRYPSVPLYIHSNHISISAVIHPFQPLIPSISLSISLFSIHECPVMSDPYRGV